MPTEPQIIDFYSKQVSLSKMNKPDLYKKCQELVRENLRLQMFNNIQEDKIYDLENDIVELEVKISNLQVDLKQEQENSKLFDEVRDERDDLCNDLSACEDENRKLKEQIEQYEKEFEELKDTEKSFEIIQNLTGELVEKEDKIIELEKELEEAEKYVKIWFESYIVNKAVLDLESDWEERYCEIDFESYAEHMDNEFHDNRELFMKAIEYGWEIEEDKCLNEEEIREYYEKLREDYPHNEDLPRVVANIDNIITLIDDYSDIYETQNDGKRMWIIASD